MGLHDELMRASRRTMLQQISSTDRLIRNLYKRAAQSIAGELRSAKEGSLTERWLKAYLQAVEQEIERMNAEIEAAIVNGARACAQARADAEREYLIRSADMAQVDSSFAQVLANVPTDSLRAMYEGKLYTDGRMLSDRIWSATGKLEGNIAEIIQQGIAQKQSPLELARQLEAYVNPNAACPVSWHKLYPDIPFDRKIDYNALRLARTSIIHVAWAADKAAAKKNPLCRGLKWHLSDSHYERQVAVAGEDVCDEYARHDEGLGAGVYPVDRIPFPHPQCLCYRTEVLPTLEESAELLGKWARGEAASPEMDAGFERWKAENREELEQLNLPDGLGGGSMQDIVQAELDKSGEFATMDTAALARAMLADPVIPDGKIYQYMLKPGSNHYRDFVEAGYVSEADGERLRQDILERCENAPFENIRYDDTYRLIRFDKYISLGPGHRFVVGWKIESGSDTPKLVTCYRKERRG
ncbi:MAG: hypothetical protein ACI4O8_02405 [Aristaeellaceae bacterium]